MNFEIERGGIRRAVSVEPSGTGRYRVTLDGNAHEVLAERSGEFGLSLILEEASGRSREVSVAAGGAPGELLVGLSGRTVTVSIDGRRRRAGGDAGAHTHGEQAVVAPMPGRIVRVLVGVGDEVSTRQGVVVVEAMKMENELRSPKAGRVRQVSVTPGTLVEAGRVLVVID
jgi:biotin carboxyl carrier protein